MLCGKRFGKIAEYKTMNIDELKKMANQFGAVVVLENDKPSFVVLPFDKYKELFFQNKDKEQEAQEVLVKHLPVQSNGRDIAKFIARDFMRENISENEGEAVENLNKEILALKEEIMAREEPHT